MNPPLVEGPPDILIKFLSDASVAGGSVKGILSRRRFTSEDLTVELKCKEEVGWSETTTFSVQGFTQTYVQHLRGESDILSYKLAIPSLEVDHGSEEVPFELQLPPGIPRSSKHVKYTLSVLSDHRPVSEPITFIVHSKSPIPSRLVAGNEGAVKFALCCNRGDIKFKFLLDKSEYSPGETINISASLQNHSKEGIRSIEMILRRVEILYSNDGFSKRAESVVNRQTQAWTASNLQYQTPPDLEECCLGYNYQLFHTLELHLITERGSTPKCIVPIFICIDANVPMQSSTEPKFIIHVPPPERVRPFDLKQFPNVRRFAPELNRSESKLSRSWTNLKSFIKTGSRIFSKN